MLQISKLAMYEILIVSPQLVRWVRVSGTFSLQTLGARPVDISDPPGHAHALWREPSSFEHGSRWRSPWFLWNVPRDYPIELEARCIERHGEFRSVSKRPLLTPLHFSVDA